MLPFVIIRRIMLIIVEGIDRVGKTTLCNMLKDKLGFKIYKHKNDNFNYSKMDNDNETDKMLQLLDLYEQIGSDVNIVFDRFHWSDFVYGKIERNYNEDKAVSNLYKITKRLNDLNALVIFVKPTNLCESSKQHGRNLSMYNRSMEECFKRSESIIREVMTDYTGLQSVVEKVKEIMEEN